MNFTVTGSKLAADHILNLFTEEGKTLEASERNREGTRQRRFAKETTHFWVISSSPFGQDC